MANCHRQHGRQRREVVRANEGGFRLPKRADGHAHATVALLVRMTTHREAANFARSLPIAGRDGSLRGRMQGTPAEGNVDKMVMGWMVLSYNTPSTKYTVISAARINIGWLSSEA